MSSLEEITERFKKHSDVLKEEVMRTTGSTDPGIRLIQKARADILEPNEEVEPISLDAARKLLQDMRGSTDSQHRSKRR